MKRRTFAKLAVALGGVSVVSRGRAATKGKASVGALISGLKFGEPIGIDLRSSGVMWRESEIHFLRFNKVRFDLDEDSSTLTARLHGAVISFDQVDYEVSGAVFDGRGVLLGSGWSRCQVERRWLGRSALVKRELAVQFGSSPDFPKARMFQFSISREAVLTPDQWARRR